MNYKKTHCEVCGRKIKAGFYQIKFHLDMTAQLVMHRINEVHTEMEKAEVDHYLYDIGMCGYCAEKINRFFVRISKRRGKPGTPMITFEKFCKRLANNRPGWKGRKPSKRKKTALPRNGYKEWVGNRTRVAIKGVDAKKIFG